MTSPSIFVIVVCCVLMNWFAGLIFSNFNVTPFLWVAGVMPCLFAYCTCDRSKVQSAARDLPVVLKVLGVGVSAVCGLKIQYATWCVLASCFYIVWTSFSQEKTLYMGDRFGAIAKQLCSAVVSRVVSDSTRMCMKGEWTFCSPYCRKLVRVLTDHYYNFREPKEVLNVRTTPAPSEFRLFFPIEDCRIRCNFYTLNEDRNDACGNEATRAGEMEPNKVEVGLHYKDEVLEEYTYFYVPVGRVIQLKRVMDILKKEGNLLFSSLHRNVGFKFRLAHARCYEFDEMLELVLKDGHTLQRVDLTAEYDCAISGSSPSGTAASLVLCFLICLMPRISKLSPEIISILFGMVLFVPTEWDTIGFCKKALTGVCTMVDPIVPSKLWASDRSSRVT